MGVTCEAGTVILIHYNVWYRALCNHSGHNRHMLKFLFCRASEPVAPDWDHRGIAWQSPEDREHDPLEPLWRAMWNWNREQPFAVEERECGSAALPDPEMESNEGGLHPHTGSIPSMGQGISPVAG